MYCQFHTCVSVILRTWIRNKRYFTGVTDPKEIGTESLDWWWSNSEKADTQFSVQRVQVSRGMLKKQRRWRIIKTLLCRWWYDWNCFSHNYFCLWAYLRSSVRFVWWIQCLSSKNGETRVGRTIWPIVRASKIVDDSTHTLDWSSCTKFYCKSTKSEWKGSHNRTELSKSVLMQDSWQQ